MSFIQSHACNGPKPGYVFTTRVAKTGYYPDPLEGGGSPSAKRQRSAGPSSSPSVSNGAGDILAPLEALASSKVVLTLSLSGIRATALALEEAITLNTSLRQRHPASPDQYLPSELALFDLVVSIRDTWPALDSALHAALCELGAWSSLVGLAVHENADVAAAALRAAADLLDVDECLKAGRCPLARRVLEDGAAPVLALNLFRFRGGDEEDEAGVGATLALFEALLDLASAGLLPPVPPLLLETPLPSFLLSRISAPPRETPAQYESNRLQCAELLSELSLAASADPALAGAFVLSALPAHESLAESEAYEPKAGTLDGVELILVSLAAYRAKDPATAQKVELVENLFAVLEASLLLAQPAVAAAFDKAEAVPLLLMMARSGLHCGAGALRVLAAAVTTPGRASEVVKGGGIKSAFAVFMQARGKAPRPAKCTAAGRELPKDKASKAHKRAAGERRAWARAVEAAAVNVLYALSRHLSAASPDDALARFVGKFAEGEGDKCDRLVELALKYDERARAAELKFLRSEEADEVEEEDVAMLALSAKLGGGGDLFHRLGAVAALVCSESKSCHARILEQLRTLGSGITLVRDAVKEFGSLLDEGEEKSRLEGLLENI